MFSSYPAPLEFSDVTEDVTEAEPESEDTDTDEADDEDPAEGEPEGQGHGVPAAISLSPPIFPLHSRPKPVLPKRDSLTSVRPVAELKKCHSSPCFFIFPRSHSRRSRLLNGPLTFPRFFSRP